VTTKRPFADAQEIASLIDHTLLKPEATESDIISLCQQALEFQFASVCVNPFWVPLVHSHLKNSRVKTCSVVGFPLGASQARIKAEEAVQALADGASEIDMVINVGALRSGNTTLVGREIQLLASAVHASSAILKVILETCLLTDEQKILACKLAKEAGADFVKTSTGFSIGGATESDVALMRSTVGPEMGVKASGGVRSLDALTRMVQAGATRIGTSSGVQIVANFKAGVAALEQGIGGSY
jgi:deoxyribose-phosphate aldolase